MADTGLKVTQFSVLTAVGHAQSHDLPLRDIADAIDMDQSSLTRAVGVFVRDGFVELNTGKDRRQKTARLTERGEALLEQATTAWRKAQTELYEIIGQEKLEDGRQNMHALRKKLSASNNHQVRN
ncbi:MarR family winged helix-turn-helix transcriptional regulator [Sulfitobacter sp. SK012]|uniref:MarR family winged helix-turn-helix transcriptional regulator n=1 Tax=Sulfitobacter sp. SK012 TaxID=1389005 RepID=UPI0013B40F81|nr:MarR family winged helix-turn-helix transcriptional regulator [Sulfitobacter sp. SK012]